jgi:D-3-phosphoglycerate dehydrogenase / 2-oxoglutarate reductase
LGCKYTKTLLRIKKQQYLCDVKSEEVRRSGGQEVRRYTGSKVNKYMFKVLFIDSVHPLIREELTAFGLCCDYFPDYTRQDFEGIIDQYSGVIIRSKIKIDKPFLDKAINLKFIGRVGSGMENIDLPVAVSKGIICLNSPEGNRDAVGEHTLGLLLSLINHINRADRQVREGRWVREGNRGIEIKGKTVGIIGYGNMGSAFAQRLKGFEANVISFDKYKRHYSDGNTIETSLDELFDSSDILSLHVPLTEETHHMVNSEFLCKFRKKIWLINTSRGTVVKTIDLITQLKKGKVTGAALDVLEYEDSSFESLSASHNDEINDLLNAENVIITPHIAGWTAESNYKLARVLVDKIKDAFPFISRHKA